MLKITVEYKGERHCVSTNSVNGKTVETDVPTDLNTIGVSFTPTDLVASALGSCLATIMAVYGERHGLDLKGTRVEIHKEMANNPRRIGKLTSEIWFPAGISKNPALEQAARTCPVHASLHSEMEKPINFHYAA